MPRAGHVPPPPQQKYAALDALLAFMHARAPWPLATLEAQPSLEAVRAAIREADTRGANSCAYFLRENAFAPAHFANALLAGGDAARYEYVPGVLARAWAGRRIGRVFAWVPYAALLGCGVAGLLFVRTCLPARLDTVLLEAAAYVAHVGPRQLEPAFAEELLAFRASDETRDSEAAWETRAMLEFALDTPASRRLLTEPGSHAPLLGLPPGAALLETTLAQAALGGAFASRNLDVYQRVFARCALSASFCLSVTLTRHFIYQVPPEVARFLLEQPRPVLESLLFAAPVRSALAQDGVLAEAFAASDEPRRDELRRALFARPFKSLLKAHWNECAPAVRSSWWPALVRRWPPYLVCEFCELIGELEPEPTVDALVDASMYPRKRDSVGDIAVERFPRMYLASAVWAAVEDAGPRAMRPAELAALRAKFARVAHTPHRLEVLRSMAMNQAALHMFIDEHGEFLLRPVQEIMRSPTMQAIVLKRVHELDVLGFLARLRQDPTVQSPALARALAIEMRCADQRMLIETLLERLERDDENYALVLAAAYIQPLDGREPPSLATCHAIVRRGYHHDAQGATRAAKSLVRTQLMGTRKRAAPS